jgi:hypothetical protein
MKKNPANTAAITAINPTTLNSTAVKIGPLPWFDTIVVVIDEFSLVLELVPTNGIIKPVLVSCVLCRDIEVESIVDIFELTAFEEIVELVGAALEELVVVDEDEEEERVDVLIEEPDFVVERVVEEDELVEVEWTVEEVVDGKLVVLLIVEEDWTVVVVCDVVVWTEVVSEDKEERVVEVEGVFEEVECVEVELEELVEDPVTEVVVQRKRHVDESPGAALTGT